METKISTFDVTIEKDPTSKFHPYLTTSSFCLIFIDLADQLSDPGLISAEQSEILFDSSKGTTDITESAKITDCSAGLGPQLQK
jgi:hypothetical protein